MEEARNESGRKIEEGGWDWRKGKEWKRTDWMNGDRKVERKRL